MSDFALNKFAMKRMGECLALVRLTKEIALALQFDRFFVNSRVFVLSNGLIVVAKKGEEEIKMAAFHSDDYDNLQAGGGYVEFIKEHLSDDNAITFGKEIEDAFKDDSLKHEMGAMFLIAFDSNPIFCINVYPE